MTPSNDVETIRCLLCQGVICYTADDDARYIVKITDIFIGTKDSFSNVEIFKAKWITDLKLKKSYV
jgi:hypothetical protein